MLEVVGYLTVFYYAMYKKTNSGYGGMVVYMLCLLVGLTFSNIPYGEKVFNNKFFYFLGRLSLPVYLSQNMSRAIVKKYCSKFGNKKLILTEIGFALLQGLILMGIVKLIKMAVTAVKNNKTKNEAIQ